MQNRHNLTISSPFLSIIINKSCQLFPNFPCRHLVIKPELLQKLGIGSQSACHFPLMLKPFFGGVFVWVLRAGCIAQIHSASLVMLLKCSHHLRIRSVPLYFFYHNPLFPCVLVCFCINVSLLIVDSFIRFPLGTI